MHVYAHELFFFYIVAAMGRVKCSGAHVYKVVYRGNFIKINFAEMNLILGQKVLHNLPNVLVKPRLRRKTFSSFVCRERLITKRVSSVNQATTITMIGM